MLQFWYRQSPDEMGADGYHDSFLIPGIVTDDDPATTLSGMVNLKLDAAGRLIYLQVIPPQKDTTAAAHDSSRLESIILRCGIGPVQTATGATGMELRWEWPTPAPHGQESGQVRRVPCAWRLPHGTASRFFSP